MELLLRWHAICLDLATDSNLLCQKLCAMHSVDQKLFSGRQESIQPIDFDVWADGIGAKRALLHAIRIQEIAERLQIGLAYPTHVPASIFAAAMVYCAFSTADKAVVSTPESVIWEDVWNPSSDLTSGETILNYTVSPSAFQAFGRWNSAHRCRLFK